LGPAVTVATGRITSPSGIQAQEIKALSLPAETLPLGEHARLTPRELSTLRRIQRLERSPVHDWRPRTLARFLAWGLIRQDERGAPVITALGHRILVHQQGR